MTEPTQGKPDKGFDPDEKAQKALRKLEAERGLLDPADRYKALVNAVKAAQDLIELADKKARFALVIMSVLNAVAILVLARSGEAVLPPTGIFALLVRAEVAAYGVATVYYIAQAIAALRPRTAPPEAGQNFPSEVEPATSMRVLFYLDVLRRDRATYRRIWDQLRADNLTAELADQHYTLSWINQQKYAALRRLYFGLTVLTIMLTSVFATIALHKLLS